jgi:hypothetical protein
MKFDCKLNEPQLERPAIELVKEECSQYPFRLNNFDSVGVSSDAPISSSRH